MKTKLKPRKSTYILHRWIGLIVCIQLLAWSLGGLIFSVLDIKSVRGENRVTEHEPQPIPSNFTPLSDAISTAITTADLDPNAFTAARLVDRGLGSQWELLNNKGTPLARVDTTTGIATTQITPEQAAGLALRDFEPNADVSSVKLLTEHSHYEFRGAPLPVYRVELNHPSNTRIYIEPVTGRVLARRNKTWRLFDFFWMLHVMDYKERDNFNHPLLTAFSALTVLTAASGIALWTWRVLPKKRRSNPNFPSQAVQP